MCKSDVNRIVLDHAEENGAGNYSFEIVAPKGYRLVSAFLSFEGALGTRVDYAWTQAGRSVDAHTSQPSPVIDRAIFNYGLNNTITAVGSAIFERSDEPDVSHGSI